MHRRAFLAAAAAAPMILVRRADAQTKAQKLARLAIMSLTFGPILKNANAPDSPARTLDLMDLGQMYADRYGVHNVELQHSYLPSTEDGWLKEFRGRLAKTKSQVTNINCEFGMLTMSAESAINRLQAIDLTKQWINHAATLGCPRIMLNQGMLSEQNRAVAVSTLRTMGEYGKSKGVKVSLEPRGTGAPEAPAYILLTEVIKASGTYANVDLANYGDQEHQHAGMRAMMPYTVGNTHMRLAPARYDLSLALKILRDEFTYQGIYLIEQGQPPGPDPYTSIQEVRDYVLEHM